MKTFDLRMSRVWDPDSQRQTRNIRAAVDALANVPLTEAAPLEAGFFDKIAEPLSALAAARGPVMVELSKEPDSERRKELQRRIIRYNASEFIVLQAMVQANAEEAQGNAER